jgi:hypothetical protein
MRLSEPTLPPSAQAGELRESHRHSGAAGLAAVHPLPHPSKAAPPAPPPLETAQPQESAAQVTARNRRLIIEWKNGREVAQGQAPQPDQDSKARHRRLIIEWQKPQQSNPQQAQDSAAANPPGQQRHSVPVEFCLGIPHAKSVQLVGAFIVRGGRRQMVQRSQGEWILTLHLLPGINYRYWFVVDGKKMLDPKNPKTERKASVLSLP